MNNSKRNLVDDYICTSHCVFCSTLVASESVIQFCLQYFVDNINLKVIVGSNNW